MKREQTKRGMLLLLALAAIGAGLVLVPPFVASQVEQVARVGQGWLYAYLVSVAVGGLLLVGCVTWVVWRLWQRWREKRHRRAQRRKNPSQLSRQEQLGEIEANLNSLRDFQSDENMSPEVREQLQRLVDQVATKQQQQQLEIVAFGTISSGKSSVLNALAGRDVFQTDARGGTTVQRSEVPWPGTDRVLLVDTPGLGEVAGADHGEAAARAARDADLVLLVVDGPLRESEHRLLTRLGEMEKRTLVCLNKRDWYGSREQAALTAQISAQVAPVVRAEDVVSVQAEPTVRPRHRVLADGQQVEERVTVPPDIEPLAERMLHVVRRDGHELLLANLLLQSRGLVENARSKVRESLDRRAWQVVDKYTWGAGGAAALSPFPVLDLLAGSAISTKMVLDLARVYRQDVDLDAAVNLLGQLAKHLVGILGVSALTPAVMAAIASLLKTVPGAGTIAGGMLQGIVQAVITRWIGAVFIGYFRQEMREGEAGLAETARREWAHVTSAEELGKIVQAARRHFAARRERDD